MAAGAGPGEIDGRGGNLPRRRVNYAKCLAIKTGAAGDNPLQSTCELATLNRYAEMVRWMGWPRTKKPKTSALPAREHDGVHVTAAPGADPGPAAAHGNTGTGQNTGVNGARHSVAETSHSARAEPAVNEEVAPVNEEITNPEVSGTRVISGSVVTGDDEEAPAGFEALGLEDAADDGAPGGEAPTLEQPAAGDRPSSLSGGSGAQPVFNATMASAPRPAEGERERRDNPFGTLFGGRESDAAPGGGGPPVTRFRDLPLDQKMRIWRLRALIVLAVGVVFTVIASWKLGVTLAILTAIADTIYRARTVVTHYAAAPGTVDRATLRAQKLTVKQLAAMERAGYLSLHRRPIPGSAEVIDHLVVGPTGVYAIDSEKWNKDVPIRFWNGRQLWLGPESKKERLEHARWEASQASERLSAKLRMEITVQPALAIYGPKVPWDIVDIRGVDVFSGDRLKKYLRRRARRKGAPHLTDEQIQKIHEAAGEVLPLEWRSAATPVG